MKKNWWNGKVAYQIWPKSFCDANGDGIGDLQGILSKLDYLQALGVDILWLSPIYKSPFVDQGYDIADYYAIAEEFGTMEEFDRLLAETKKRGMHIIMDLVVNHCSDQHDWFQKALADPHGEYAERFYFLPGRDGGPPSNYRGYFGGSTWEPVPGTELYYLHMFAKEQPDLNWENPVVRQKIYNMVNWWLEKGLAGFRIDAIINIKKVPGFPDYPVDGPDGLASCTKMVEAAKGVGGFLQELKRETFAKHDAFTVGEVFNMKENELAEFIGDEGHFSTMFDFSAHELTFGENGWYDSKPLRFEDWRRTLFAAQKKVENVGFWANIIENHDEPRGVSRYLPSHAQNEAGAKMLGTTSLLLRGIPFIFQGQEIGMTNCRRTDISQYDDINTKDQYQVALDAGCTVEQALEACYVNSRDNARTPVQWSDAPHGGFTTGQPWLAVNPNYTTINVAEQEGREDSVLNHYRRLVALRKSAVYGETFTYGAFEPVWETEPDILAYLRRDEAHTILVAGNYGPEARTVTLPAPARELLLSNLGREELPAGTALTLASCESAVILL
ncbi:MAG: alpha-glucosidase [Oscillibacter sp.]|nr:alpha-glucosidase [Oscillibacter sp.]